MNAADLQKEFAKEFPVEVKGYKRPAYPLDSENDFFLEIPPLIPKDPVLYSKMNLILSVLLSNDNRLQTAGITNPAIDEILGNKGGDGDEGTTPVIPDDLEQISYDEIDDLFN